MNASIPADEEIVDLDDEAREFIFKDGHTAPYDDAANAAADQRLIVANYETRKAIKDEITAQTIALEKHEIAMQGVLNYSDDPDMEAIANAITDVIAVLKNVSQII